MHYTMLHHREYNTASKDMQQQQQQQQQREYNEDRKPELSVFDATAFYGFDCCPPDCIMEDLFFEPIAVATSHPDTQPSVLEETLDETIRVLFDEEEALYSHPPILPSSSITELQQDRRQLPPRQEQYARNDPFPLNTSWTQTEPPNSAFNKKGDRFSESRPPLSPVHITLSRSAAVTTAGNRIYQSQDPATDQHEGCVSPTEDLNTRFRPYQASQWDIKFEELLKYKTKYGHCSVPHTFPQNPSIARWVKRQRYQYKLMVDGKASTMTERRAKTLEQAGFVWDAHNMAWEDRLGDLQQYLEANGDCNVPTIYPPHRQLATWVKCQRRQYKLFCQGKTSTINRARIQKLDSMGFTWRLRAPRRVTK